MNSTWGVGWIVGIVCACGILGRAEAAPSASLTKLQAQVGFESAALGAMEQTEGFTVSVHQWLGVRFTADKPYYVSSVGGHVSQLVSGDLFVAVFPTSENGLPPSPPDLKDAVFVRTFAAPQSSTEVRIPTDLRLPPGEWALVFGSGEQGARGHGVMPGNNRDIGSPSYFTKVGDSWRHGGLRDARFFVQGTHEVPRAHAVRR